jgi:hypothetical protein
MEDSALLPSVKNAAAHDDVQTAMIATRDLAGAVAYIQQLAGDTWTAALDDMVEQEADAAERAAISCARDEASVTPPYDSPNASSRMFKLREAVGGLYLRLGGVDYRQIAESTVNAAEALSNVAKGHVAEFQSGGYVSAAALAGVTKTFVQLADETKKLLGVGGGSKRSPKTLQPAHRESDIKLDGQQIGRRHQRTGSNPSTPTADELYDLGALMPNQRGAAVTINDDEDIVALLKHRTKQLSEDRSRLNEEVRRLERHLSRLQEQCKLVIDPILHQNTELDERIRELDRGGLTATNSATAASAASPVSGSTSNASPREGDAEPFFFAPRNAPSTAPTGAARPPAVYSNQLSNSSKAASTNGEQMSKAVTPASKPTKPSALSLSDDITSPSTLGGSVSSPPPPHVAHGSALAYAYEHEFRFNGMAMIWNTIHLAFTREFDSTPCAAPLDHDGGASEGGAPPATSEPSDAALADFQREFMRRVASVVAETSAFKQQLGECETPLLAAYLGNCLHSKVKVNSGVKALLDSYKSERDVVHFSLDNNLVGEARIMPLLPLFDRMYRLRTLNLANNGLKNRAVQTLAAHLQTHPSLAVLDLSGNPFSRVGGKALLNLVISRPRLVQVRAENTQMEGALKDRIYAAAHRNAKQSHQETDEGAVAADVPEPTPADE